MKKILLMIVLLTFCLGGAAWGQDLQGMFCVSPFGGLGMPMGDMGDDDAEQIEDGDALYRKMGFKFGVAAEYFFTSNLGAGLEFRYATFGAKDVEYEGETYTTDDKLNLMMFGAHAKYLFMPDGTVRPYGLLGAGMVMSKIKDWDQLGFEEKADLDVDTKLYLIFGGGVTYFVSPTVSIFGELTFDYLMLDGAKLEVDGEPVIDDDGEVEVEANYYFLDFVVGVNIWFGGTE